MYKSLEYFMEKYPFFLSKKSDSNFTKTKKVFNNRLQDISNNIFITYLASKLEKTVLVWKEQEDEYDYIINFIANVPLLKTVTCYKNDEVIYCESYNYEDNVSTFVYSYEDTSVNVIPDDKFLISVETWEEYTLAKGFPENDTYQDDEYDHDLSLDDFGLLYDMPRKTYVYKDNTNLADTEPPFNNRLTEDDYHYMNRLLFYISHLNDTPLPVLEIWKLFGIPLEEIEFTNRERYLCKMYSQKLHGGDDWEPEPWEHKDSMGCYSIEDLFFFVEVDNPTPVVGQIINFIFTFMDMFGEKKTTDFLINVYLDDVLIKSGVDPSHDYSFDTTDVEASTLVFRFEAESESIIQTLVSDDFIVTLKDCNTADWYVSLEGSDVTGDGSQLNPFKTLPKALSMVEGSRNVIVLCEGEFTINTEQVISTSTSIISCNEAIIRNDTSIDFFRILQGCNLYLKNVALKYKCCTMQDNFGFINNNITQNPIYIRMNAGLIVDGVNLLCRPQLTFDLDEISDNMYAHSNITVTGTLLTADDTPEPVEGETVELMGSGEVLDTSITDEDGEFELEYLINTVGDHTFNCKIEDSQEYCESVSEDFTVTASAMPTSLSATMSSTLLWGDDLNVVYSLEDYYDNPVTVGAVKLMEGSTVVASVNAGETLTYTPPLGDHTYKLVFEAPDNTWIASETETFEVEVTADELQTVFTGSTVSLSNLSIGGTGDAVLIDWGDGTTELYTGGGTSHTYTDGLSTHDVTFTRRTITSLGYNCFYNSSGLTSVTIPNSITSLGTGCFYGCSSLIDYQLYWTNNNIITYNSSKMPNNTNTLFIIPVGETSNYESAGYPSSKIVERGDTLILTADYPIIKSGETSTITAKLLHDGRVASGETLFYEIKHGSTTIDSGTDTTDNNGEIDLTYTGTAIGQVDVIISYGTLLQETYELLDCMFYDGGVTGNKSTAWTASSNISISTDDAGTLLSASSNQTYTSTTLLSGDFEVIFQATNSGGIRIGFNKASNQSVQTKIITPTIEGTYYYKINRIGTIWRFQYSSDGETWNNRSISVNNITDEDCYFLFSIEVVGSTRTIKYKDLKIYSI